MSITLTPDLEALVAEQIECGRFQTAEDVIAAGLQMVKNPDTRSEALRRIAKKLLQLQEHKSSFSTVAELNEFIEAAEASRNRGDMIPAEEVEKRLAGLARDWRDAGL